MFGINVRKLNLLSGIANRELIGIDSSGNSLKLAYVKVSPGNRGEVVNLFSRNITGLTEDDISKIIVACLKELKPKRPEIINIIPSHLVITKNVEIPSTDPAEIREIINLQAARHTPYSRDEIIVDYIDLGTHKHSYTRILLVIVARKAVKMQFEILDKTGFKSERVFFAPEGLAWFVSKILRLDTADSPLNLIHIDEGFTDFAIVLRDKLLFIRSIPIGAQHLVGEKEKYQVKFLEELRRSLEVYQNEDIEKNPNMLVLTGAVQGLEDLEAVLRDTLHLSIRNIPYFRSLPVSNEILKTTSLAKDLSFLGVIAPLLAWESMKVNLIPEEVKLRKLVEERGRDLIRTGILGLAVFVLIFLILISKVYFKTVYLKNLNSRYQTLNQETQKLEVDFTKVSLIKNYLTNRGYHLEVLAELSDLTPLDLELNDIRSDEQARFSVKGTAESMSTVFSFVDNMEKSKYFKDVKTKYTRKRKDGLRDVADFEITSLLDKGANR